jgi:hypothetical protein
MTAGNTAAGSGRWSALLHGAQGLAAVEKAREYLAEHRDRPEGSTDIAYLEILLRQVVANVEDVTAVPSADLLDFALEVVALAGGGTEFRGNTGIITSAQALIDRLHTRGYPTTELLLSLARYQSRFQIGSHARQVSIERALAAAATDEERVRARIINARFNIDTSDYRGALTHLQACDPLLETGDLRERYGRSVLTTTGMAHFYTDHQQAAPFFQHVVESADREITVPGERQAVSEALHYLGRIAGADRRFQDAVDLYVQARPWAGKELEWEGYHHLRVAEILFDHGTPAETVYHLDRARQIFVQGLQQTSGEAQLDALDAHLMARGGDVDGAKKLLNAGIAGAKTDGFRRGQILFRVELAKLHLADRDPVPAVPLMLMAGLLYLGEATAAGPRSMLAQLRTGAKFALGILASVFRKRASGPMEVVICRCGEHQ